MTSPYGTQQPNPFGARFAKAAGNAGTVLIVVGVLLIAYSWYQISGETQVAAQVPYIVSGAMLGLALVIAGAAVLITQSQRESKQALVEALRAMGSVQGHAGGGPRSAVQQLHDMTPDDAAGLVVAGSSSYHRPDCRLVEGRDSAEVLTAYEAEGRGLAACRVCRPAGASDTAAVPVVRQTNVQRL